MVVSAIGKRLPIVLGFARESVTVARRAAYHRLERANPVEPKSALFKAYSGRNYADSPRAIYEAMLRDARFDEFTLYWVFREPIARSLAARGYDVRGLDASAGSGLTADLEVVFGEQALADLRRATIVVWGSPEHNRAHARSAYWFCNTVIPWHIAPRKDQAYVQMWHGTPLKKLGNDIEPAMARNALYSWRQTHRRYAREGQRITYLVTPSRFASDKLSSAFAFSEKDRAEKILELGYPRNDALRGVDDRVADAIRVRLGIPKDKRVVLYAPTWRDDQHSSALGYTLELPADFERLRSELGEDHVLLFRTHYLIGNRFDFERYGGFVIDVSAVSDVNDLYVVSDVLVTDYSSVFFDYANLERPIVFYMYDLDEYATNMRGLYVDPGELPGPIARTDDELVAALRSAGTPDADLGDRYRRFGERFTYLDDGHASQRVIERVIAR
jgi:CDP-glycerol glycerophosphotransferase